MKPSKTRRQFLQQLGVGSTLLASSPLAGYSQTTQDALLYPSLASFQNEDGHYLLRISVRYSQVADRPTSASLRFEGGRIARTKNYFLPVEQPKVQDNRLRWQMAGDTAYPYVLIAWLSPEQETVRLSLKVGQTKEFTLAELFEQAGLEYSTDQFSVEVGLLGTQEVGTLDASLLGVPTDTQNFNFAVMADPQGGDPDDKSNGSLTRIKIHNAFVEDSVELIRLLENPAFCLVLGDIVDGQGQMPNFEEMLAYFKRVDAPWLFSVGNHETKYRIEFGTGYDWSDFANYFAAQQSMNGSSKLLYSFDIGQWHFVVWPDPLRRNFWETHPHYFDWLESDLAANKDRPTFFFQHVPAHPIGINPLIAYVESVAVKRTLLDILAKHGNVRYVLSGHVHIPMLASIKTAVSYRGMKLINLPAAGFRPRAFGEEDLTGGPVQGIAAVRIEDEQAHLEFRTVTDEVYAYPESLPESSPDTYPLWLQHKWELPAQKQLVNGDFSQGLTGWHGRYVYEETERPANVREVRSLDGQPALYLFSRTRGYRSPGQDRLPQTINRVAQAVSLEAGQLPVVRIQYQVDDASNPESWAGAFVWVEGYQRDYKRLNHIYAIGRAYGNLRDQHQEAQRAPTGIFSLPLTPGQLRTAHLNVGEDYEKTPNVRFATLQLDRLVISLGVWTANERPDQQWSVYFAEVAVGPSPTVTSLVNGAAVSPAAESTVWWKMVDHIAGEHIHVDDRYVPTRRS
ncbi:MAG: metallophosphoesterase [Tunicatimonas sp.]